MTRIKAKTKNKKTVKNLKVRIIKAPFVNSKELANVVLMRSRALVL